MALGWNKRNIRILSITGVLLFVIFLISQNNNGMLTDPSGLISDAFESTSVKGMIDSDNVRVGGKVRYSSDDLVKGTAKDDKVNAEIDKIKEEVGLPFNDNNNNNIANKKLTTDNNKNNVVNEKSTVQNNAAQRAVQGGSEPVKFDPAQEYAIISELSPIILYTKTFCPYCKRLAKLLEESYSFQPEFHAVKLDKHTHGDELQQFVNKQTGHNTVPNFVINGKSLGGYDDILKLHEAGKLIETIQEMSDYSVVVKAIEKPSNS
ncbi:hypothetical protein Kpol_1045p69 [Vanderwaltozyma polyspora DSM 70294]|uniref:Glutaredoxin domain-containing protein n=1 Tax=Vanderwaltozyma polyspora (strain ATCC 22028 / DSM 70294 / BCRC 21397 / CBS 2163 / NBRC 10782 / NRRL Y-8283 / UCD 57-17) TaxID=436907 RepID=A7TI75_VANPO|nr:uncharacterized protein Kpol_1045p69 [Vanderwaltozyma polyspora DSM 70294]EDO18082.1 hypothetical protein Kpol_1045p69 [Vanderwaltozyma polyspora DSM 70294]